jgi:hypothetical protein
LLSAPGGPPPAWIQYEFDQVYTLHEMWVWNHNLPAEPILGFGFRNVTVQYSANGADWTTVADTEFARVPGSEGYTHNTTVSLGGVAAKYVKLTIEKNWGVTPQTGLSEVRFFCIQSVAAPKP